MNQILLSTLESIVESRTRLRADRAGAFPDHGGCGRTGRIGRARACRNGGQPSSRERAAAGGPGARAAADGPGGRLRANRTGACADQYSKQ